MSTDTKAPRKRRSISKANLLKEINKVVAEYDLGETDEIGSLVDAIKNSIVADAMK